ncbi:MAG: glycosyltransferase family 4 protein [Tannerella sp.]|jgi:glycosyltransferase involved in cell wall biosynthesis|nr:glycosyltransferase family 4 protein [Tannerella sp.]
MKIGYILDTNPLTDRRSYSGINYYTCKALMKVGFEVVWIPVKRYFFEYALFGFLKRLFRLFGKNIGLDFIWRAFFSNLSLNRKMLDTVDYILVHHITDGYFLRTRKPVITYQDATLFSCIDYYSETTGLTKWNKSDIKQLEKRLYEKSSRIIAASDWHATSLKIDYFIPDHKIVRINFGANIDDDGILPAPVASPENGNTVNILFIGIDWVRKGGNMAILICEELIKKGINAHLHILGSTSPLQYANLLRSDAYTVYGLLNKNNPKDYRRFTDILSKADLLLTPTIAEAAGIMFCEASAYGIPIFTHHTGGTASYVVNGVNGYGFPVGTDAEIFADKIRECIISGELKKLRKSGRQWYEQNSNWDLFGQKFKRMIEQIAEEQK